MKGYAYDEFGKTEQSGDNAFENEVTFAGSVADLSSGLQYMNARYYQPSTGRFLSQDSYTGNAYDPWTQHLYIYCGNNPTSMIDPTGFASAYSPFSSKRDPYERRKGKSLSGTKRIRNKKYWLPDTLKTQEDLQRWGDIWEADKGQDSEYSLKEIMIGIFQYKTRKMTGTGFIQLEGSLCLAGGGGTASLQIVGDLQGNRALQYSYGGGTALSEGSASANINIGITNAKNIGLMEKMGAEVGGGGGNIIGGSVATVFGVDAESLNQFVKEPEVTYSGGCIGVGVTTPGGDVHGWITNTQTITTWHFWDDPIISWMFDWLEARHIH